MHACMCVCVCVCVHMCADRSMQFQRTHFGLAELNFMVWPHNT